MVLNDLLGPLNQLARPLIKAGLGGPCLTPFGLVVIEVLGRRTGIVREVPLLALRHRFEQLKPDHVEKTKILQAARAGLIWLLALQNRDGGWPTFCRGWGVLPFDRSGADLFSRGRDLHPATALLYQHRQAQKLSLPGHSELALHGEEA